jgi:hypothetical protein
LSYQYFCIFSPNKSCKIILDQGILTEGEGSVH